MAAILYYGGKLRWPIQHFGTLNSQFLDKLGAGQ